MFFYFSKILEFFIYPFNWILILAIIALATKRKTLKKKLLITAGLLLVIFTNPLLANEFGRLWDIPSQSSDDKKVYSCGIVLGGFSSELANGHGYFNEFADRFIQAAELYNTGKVRRILVTGGNGALVPDQFKEADWVKQQLLKFRVPDSCVIAEDKSRNTIENAAFSKIKLDSAHLTGPYLLITSSFHMRRSLQIFKKTGLNVVPYPCDPITSQGFGGIQDFLPDPGVLCTWNIYIKEVIGYAVNLLR